MTLPLLPSFMLAGFECSSPINRNGDRVDELALTQHDRHVRADYALLRRTGIHAARDGIRWNLIDRRGRLDFSSARPFLEAAAAEEMTILWDLFHYGYPDDLDPFTETFIQRFADYCYAFARLARRYGSHPPLFTPVNEISYFAWAGGDQGMFAPHTQGRGPELKRQLARASIQGMKAILAVEPEARFVHCEPLVYVVAPADAPELEEAARWFSDRCVHEAWDMIGGYLEPELGGSPRLLDIVGVNYYGYNQWEHTRPDNVLARDDSRRLPFSELLARTQARYQRPLIVSETTSHGDLRAPWLREIGQECLRARDAGVDLHGLCLYPIVDMFDWHEAQSPLNMGLWELHPHADDPACLTRVPHTATMTELRLLQERLETVEAAEHRPRDYEILPRPFGRGGGHAVARAFRR